MNKNLKIGIAVALLVCIVGVMVITLLGSFAAYADTLQNQLNDATQRKQDIKEDLNKVQSEKKSVLAEKNAIQSKIDTIEGEMDEIQKEIDSCDARISEKNTELEEAQQTADKQYDAMKIRLRTMYEDNSTSYISLIFGGESITDVLGYIEIIKQLVTYDNNMYEELLDVKETIAQAKAEIEKEKSVSEAAKSKQAAKKKELSGERDALSKTVAKLTSDEAAYKKAYEEAEAEENSLKAQLYPSISGNGAVGDGVKYTGGQLVWPAPGYRTVTSPYGMRMHPTLHVYKLHTGIDIAAPGGANVVAAAAGTVTSAGWNNAYGWYIVINHGGGLSTLYAHHSKLLVSSGQNVKAGQNIGKVGSTGFSTGPHLHYEVMKNGNTVNPMGYY